MYSKKIEQSLLKIIYLMISCSIIIVPIFFLYSKETILFPYSWAKIAVFLFFTIIAFASYIFIAFHNPEYRPRFNHPITIALLSFIFFTTLSSLFALNVQLAFWGIMGRTNGLILFYGLFGWYLILKHIFHIQQFKNLFYLSLIPATVIAGLEFFDADGSNMLPFFANSLQSGNLLGNSSIAATYLMFNLATGLYLLVSDWKKKTRRWLLLGFFLLTFVSPFFLNFKIFTGDIAPGSFIETMFRLLGAAKTPIIVMIFGAFFIISGYLVLSHKNIKKIIGGILLTLTFALFAWVTVSISRPEGIVRQTMEQLTNENRTIFWEIGMKGFKEKPILGWGDSNYYLVFQKYFDPSLFRDKADREIWVDFPHNIYIEQLTEGGIVGLLSYLAIFVSVWFVLVREYFFRKNLSKDIFIIFSSLYLVYFLRHIILFEQLGGYIMLFLTLAFVTVVTQRGKHKEQNVSGDLRKYHPYIFYGLAGILIAGTILGITFLTIKPIKKQYVFSHLILLPVTERIHSFESMTQISPLGSTYDLTYIGAFLKEFYENVSLNIIRQNTPLALKDILNTVDQLDKTLLKDPDNYRTHLTISQLLNLALYIANQPNEEVLARSRHHANRALEISPSNQQSYWIQGQILLYELKPHEALQMFEKAVDLDPYVKESHDRVLHVLRLSGDRSAINARIKYAQTFIPDYTFNN